MELHLNDLVNYGLGAATGYTNIDLECAMYACMAIQQMIPTDKVSTKDMDLLHTLLRFTRLAFGYDR